MSDLIIRIKLERLFQVVDALSMVERRLRGQVVGGGAGILVEFFLRQLPRFVHPEASERPLDLRQFVTHAVSPPSMALSRRIIPDFETHVL